MYKQMISTAAMAFLTASGTFAQETPAAAPDTAPVQCTDTRSATEILEQEIRQWRASDLGMALAERDANGQLALLVSSPELIMSSTQSANYGKSRELAYARAFLNTQAQFVQARRQTIETETASEFFNAAPSSAELSLDDPKEKNRLLRMGEKVFTLTEAKLDHALR